MAGNNLTGARRNRITIVGSGLDKWIEGLDKIDNPDALDEEIWAQANDMFFDRTQQFVHIITADLKASGTHSTTRQKTRITGEVKYGGTEEVDYAVYEFRRGGNHDALGRGFEVTSKYFQQALAQMIEDKVGRWK